MIRFVLLLLLFLISKFSLKAQETEKVDIIVTITNFKNDEGKAMVALYDREEEFLKVPFRGMIGEIDKNTSTVIFKNVDAGIYAIGVFHDEDEDRKLDMFMGMIPKEPIACSNNARAKFGPPKWEDSKFKVVDENVVQRIAF